MKLLTEDERYQAIYDLVLNVCNLPSLPEEYSDSETDRWINIILVCDDYSGYEDCELIYAAIHKIRWGKLPDRNYSDTFVELIDLVVAELLRDGEAFNSWYYYDTLHVALGDAEDQKKANCADGPSCFTYEHRAYLNSRMFNDVVYSKDSIVTDLGIVEDVDFEFFEFKRYEKIILRLIPEAANWEKFRWTDERNIYDALLCRYGVNFFLDSKSYNKLIGNLADFWFPSCEEYEEEFLVETSLDISVLSYDLAKAIWPSLTEDDLADLFLHTYQNVAKYGSINGESPMYRNLFSDVSYDAEVLKNSWLTKVIADWISSGNCYGTNPFAVKKALFNLAMLW